ncbi:unnamed protein product [Prunus brigantina]
MKGAQTLVTYKKSDGSMDIKTFNISSYRDIVKSKLAFDVWDTSTESSGGVFRLFAKLKVEEISLNQVCVTDSPMTADDHAPQSPPDPNPNVHNNPFLEISAMPWLMAKTQWSWKKKRRKRAGLSRSHRFNPTKS